MTKKSRTAVLDALCLVGKPTETAEVALSGAVLPTAKARQAVDTLAIAGSPEGFDERGLDLKGLLGGALNWDDPKFTRATKAVTRTFGQILSGTNSKDESTYAAGVEMLSFLAGVAPLLEPDRLDRIAQYALDAQVAYGHLKYLTGFSGQLKLMLSGYQEARREELIIDLWNCVHAGRWWDHTTGDRFVRNDGHRLTTGSRRRAMDMDEEQRNVVTRQVQELLDGRGEPTAELLARAVRSRSLSYTQDMADLMSRIVEPDKNGRQVLLDALASSDDEDHRVLAAHIPWLKAVERPECPAAIMTSVLLTVLGGPAEFRFAAALPSHPQGWDELYPEASREAFPIPEPLRSMQGKRLPGLTGSDTQVCWNADLLKRNANHMGNCTFSYLSRCQQGTTAILRVAYAGTDYNVAVNIAQNGYTLGEINSRFNAGNVPTEVSDAANILVQHLPRN